MNDPDGLTGDIGHLDPIEILDPIRWRRPWTQCDPWARYLTGHQEKTAARILAELRGVACETRKRLVNGRDVDDQFHHTAGLRDRPRDTELSLTAGH